MSFHARAVRQHFKRLQSAAGEEVIVTRDGRKACCVAVPGESRFEIVQSDGTIVEFRTHDFIIGTHCLDFGDGNGPTLPKRKDRYEWEQDGELKNFECLPDSNLPHYRRIGPGNSEFRVFTKEISFDRA